MTTTEVVVAVLKSGYQTTMSKGNLRCHVGRERGERFKSDGGKAVGA